jgi:hypothetical protein
MKFSDSLAENLEVCSELLQGVPPDARRRAKSAAARVERVFTAIQADYPKDPAAALGFAYAIFKYAEKITERHDNGNQPGLIQLLQ